MRKKRITKEFTEDTFEDLRVCLGLPEMTFTRGDLSDYVWEAIYNRLGLEYESPYMRKIKKQKEAYWEKKKKSNIDNHNNEGTSSSTADLSTAIEDSNTGPNIINNKVKVETVLEDNSESKVSLALDYFADGEEISDKTVNNEQLNWLLKDKTPWITNEVIDFDFYDYSSLKQAEFFWSEKEPEMTNNKTLGEYEIEWNKYNELMKQLHNKIREKSVN